ncbi:MAG: hypothetical protein SZ59_C0002G0232 [candidate division TM6 bacterium GW2011_GWF2_28_16]|nr:MAG: hypothetical protein SZ59_C0002G0232 [candidate division TM6 bacterium GW2011_GWF2_28_16]
MLNNQMLELLNVLAILFPTFMVIFTFRGFFKALVARLMGDDTAYELGFMSLNPLVHINLTGFVAAIVAIFILSLFLSTYMSLVALFVIIILIGAQFTIPTPINENKFKNYSLGIIFVTLVVPITNFLTALLFMYGIKYLPISLLPKYAVVSFKEIFGTIIEISIIFGVLDLIPLPPFDGGRLLRVLLPKSMQHIVDWLERYSFFILLTLFFMPIVKDYFLGAIYLVALLIKVGLAKLVF